MFYLQKNHFFSRSQKWDETFLFKKEYVTSSSNAIANLEDSGIQFCLITVQERCIKCFEKEPIDESFPINLGCRNKFYTRDS